MSQFQKQADEGKVYTAAMLVLGKKKRPLSEGFQGLHVIVIITCFLLCLGTTKGIICRFTKYFHRIGND